MLEVRAGRFRVEVRAGRAWMGAEPFLHVSLVLVFGGLVSKYVGHFAGLLVICSGDSGTRRWRSSGDAEGVPVESVFVRDGCW